MALTLPYPDLVFVPLDILTAEEQNEIVANYTYISNQFPIQSSNIDFTTIVEVIGTTTGGEKNYALKFADGRLICIIQTLKTVSITSSWGSLYSLDISGSSVGNWAEQFIDTPSVSISASSVGTSVIIASFNAASTTTAASLTLVRPTTISNARIYINEIAYGFWK